MAEAEEMKEMNPPEVEEGAARHPPPEAAEGGARRRGCPSASGMVRVTGNTHKARKRLRLLLLLGFIFICFFCLATFIAVGEYNHEMLVQCRCNVGASVASQCAVNNYITDNVIM